MCKLVTISLHVLQRVVPIRVRKFCSTTMQDPIRPTQSRYSCKNSSARFSVTLHTVQTFLPAITPFFVPQKRLWGANDSPRTTTSSSTCGTGSQHSPGKFTRQPFKALCRSGTSASTTRANTSDIQVLVTVPKPPARFFFNARHNFKISGMYSCL